jgi:hypothetical protein
LIDELSPEDETLTHRSVLAAKRIALEHALAELDGRSERVLVVYEHRDITRKQLDGRLRSIDDQRDAVRTRLDLVRQEADEVAGPTISPDLLSELRARLDAGLDLATKQEIVRLLVRKIVVHTEQGVDGKGRTSLVISYRFPQEPKDETEAGVDPTRRGRGSSRRRVHVQIACDECSGPVRLLIGASYPREKVDVTLSYFRSFLSCCCYCSALTQAKPPCSVRTPAQAQRPRFFHASYAETWAVRWHDG